MSVISKAVDQFVLYQFKEGISHKEFLKKFDQFIGDFSKTESKMESIRLIRQAIKYKYDEHLLTCQYKDNPDECSKNISYESVLFFLEERKSDIGRTIPSTSFSIEELNSNKDFFNDIISRINELKKDADAIKLGNQIIYDDIIKELADLKDYLYLPKKNFREMAFGKFASLFQTRLIEKTTIDPIIDECIQQLGI